LVRVTGPLAGYLCAMRLACAFGAVLDVPADRIPAALESAFAAASRVAPVALRPAPLAFVVSGAYGGLGTHPRLQGLEGMLAPVPPAWDLLHLAHGPFQQAIAGPAVFLALTRADAPQEEPLLVRFEAMLDPARQTLLRLHASLPSPFAILEHEMHLN